MTLPVLVGADAPMLPAPMLNAARRRLEWLITSKLLLFWSLYYIRVNQVTKGVTTCRKQITWNYYRTLNIRIAVVLTPSLV